jgi:hypothetical protein
MPSHEPAPPPVTTVDSPSHAPMLTVDPGDTTDWILA